MRGNFCFNKDMGKHVKEITGNEALRALGKELEARRATLERYRFIGTLGTLQFYRRLALKGKHASFSTMSLFINALIDEINRE